MSSLLARGLALLVLGAPLAQTPEGRLSLDELIERLPKVDAEWSGPPEKRKIDPASAEMWRRLQDGVVLTDDQWRRALLGTGVLRVHARLPASEPFAVSLRRSFWLQIHVLVLDPERVDLPLRSACVGYFYNGWCGVPVSGRREAWLHQRLGVLPAGRQMIPFHLELWKRDGDDATEFAQDEWLEQHLARDLPEPAESGIWEPRKPILVAESDVSIAVEVVPSLDDALPPARSAEVDAAVRRALILSSSLMGRPRIRLLSLAPPQSDSRLEGLGLQLEVELLRDSEVRSTGRLQRGEPDLLALSAGLDRAALGLEALPNDVERDPLECARWRLRVRSRDEDALRDYDATCRWSGGFELPLAELLARAEPLEKR